MATKKRMSKRTKRDNVKSRRSFMRQAILGSAGATAAALGTAGVANAAEEDVKPIVVPSEFEKSKRATLPTVDFPMSGAQVFARACKEEGVKGLFCCPGNYDVVHAIMDTGIPTYSGRHEGCCNFWYRRAWFYRHDRCHFCGQFRTVTDFSIGE